MARKDKIEANQNDVVCEILRKRIASNEGLVKIWEDNVKDCRKSMEQVNENIIKVKNEVNALKKALKVLNPT